MYNRANKCVSWGGVKEVKSNKLTSLILLFVILFSFCLASCSSGTTTANSMPATSVIELFEKAGKVFAELDSTDVISVTVTVRSIEQVKGDKVSHWDTSSIEPTMVIEQDNGYLSAEVWIDATSQSTSSSNWATSFAQSWLERNKYYLTQSQKDAVENWIKDNATKICPKDDPLCVNRTTTGSWGYKLYSPSLVDAQKGNFDVWFWTDLDKAPEGEITNWEPTILVHWGVIPEEVHKELFELVSQTTP